MEIGSVDRITAGAVGEPGHRTFYLQARSGLDLVTVIVEKQQVELLAASILEILSRADKETGQAPVEEELELEEPVEPLWRVGRLSIGYAEERDRVLLELEELVPEEDDEGEEEEGEESEAVDEDEEGVREPERVRIWATREQMLGLSLRGAAVLARGRPSCDLCGNPIDPEGHTCPALNGHGRSSR